MNDRDQAAIDHVASVSKHPHAAMIVKWLITGCEIEFYDDEYKRWVTVGGNPTWYDDIKYRIIEQKPAYRVYINKNTGYTSTLDSKGGFRGELPCINGKWISGWIEYDEPKKWPTPLVESIAEINMDAANWIVDHWDDLLDDKYTYRGNYSRDSETLDLMFDWSESDINANIWEEISTKLGE